MEELLDDTRPALQVGHILVMVEVMVEVIIIQVVGAGLLVEEVRADIQETAVADHGMVPTGLYEVINNQHEVVMVWATSVDAWVDQRQSRDAARGLDDSSEPDERLVAWEQRSAEYVTGGDTHVMTPLPRTVYGPPDWESADLSDWIEE